ncbi:MAG: SUMF1/EgtB/PvdO family nonheme iron enzyme [Rhizobiales bacterium]|nr:SUMF1/EgtB/PvdO family nonheme iron enzyme [Hyphomicrobiales bacterium]
MRSILVRFLLTLAVAIFGAAPARAEASGPRFALLIANQDYQPGVGALRNPHNDIRIVGEALRKVGFEVLEPVRDGTRVTILLAVNDFAARLAAAGPNATGFLYYSGHGIASDGENYIIPTDVPEPSTRLLRVSGVRQSEILDILRTEAPRAAHYLVLDACRNELRGDRGGKGFLPVQQRSGALIAFAAAPGRTASDRGDGSGPYAAALAAELVVPGQSDLIMFHNVRLRVLDATGNDQEPWTLDGIRRRERLQFAGRAEAAPAGLPNGSEAERLWQTHAIETTTDRGLIEAYIAQFEGPAPLWAYRARQRLAALEAPAAPAPAAPAPSAGTPAQPAPSAPSEPAGPQGRELALAVQRELARLGCRPGEPDGLWGPASAGALARWREHARVAEVGSGGGPSLALLRQLEGQTGTVCPAERYQPGETFRDCPDCPLMVVVPAGSFMMGSPESEEGRNADEGPQRRVTLRQPFAVGKFEVTFAQWDACVAAKGCKHKPSDENWGRGQRPVMNVSWDDIENEYLPWLNRTLGLSGGGAYRLLSEAEWEYAARGGTTTPFSFGATISTDQANYDGNYTYGSGRKGAYREKTVEVGSFPGNAFGLHDMHGNVWEWVEDPWHENYNGAPTDGSAWTKDGDTSLRVVRGGSWNYLPGVLRSANRLRNGPDNRNSLFGFRVARSLSR